jgi:hypothetical protein
MKTRLLFALILALTGFLNVSAQLINVNPDPNGDIWLVGGDIPLTAEELSKIPQMVPTAAALSNTLPSSCDNSQFKYMAPVVLQKGQSCRQFA